MNQLIDLNASATNFIAEGEVEALATCMEYSLQPEKILQLIYESKRYECLPPVLPLLSVLFQQSGRHPTGIAILLDLLEKKETLPPIGGIDMNYLYKRP